MVVGEIQHLVSPVCHEDRTTLLADRNCMTKLANIYRYFDIGFSIAFIVPFVLVSFSDGPSVIVLLRFSSLFLATESVDMYVCEPDWYTVVASLPGHSLYFYNRPKCCMLYICSYSGGFRERLGAVFRKRILSGWFVWRLRGILSEDCSVLDCVTQCSQSAARLYEQFLQVRQIGFVTLGPLHCVLELYNCNMAEWFWWDSSLITTTNWFPSVL